MSVSNDQPISAGNLKAALDGLTGGGSLVGFKAPMVKVLYKNDNLVSNGTTIKLSDSIVNFDLILIAFGRYSMGDLLTNPAAWTRLFYTGKMATSISDRYRYGNNETAVINIKGDAWAITSYDSPRLVLGINIS